MSKIFFLIFLLFLVLQPFPAQPRSLKSTSGESLDLLQNSEGVTVAGAREYLKAFGYLDNADFSNANNNISNELLKADHDGEFDEGLETALKRFQKYYNLNVSGKLDSETIKLMSMPRCGVPDNNNKNLIGSNAKFATSKYSFFTGNLQWPDNKNHLTYRFQPSVEIEPIEVMSNVFRIAFGQWSSVSSFTFEEVSNGTATDIVIGFFRRGDHGDGVPFEKHVLGHAFAPTDGRLHLNADQRWSSHIPMPRGHLDLVAAAMHEIGHILGLDHSSDHKAIMYPYLNPGVNKRVLGADDIAGIRGLCASPDIEYSTAVVLSCDYCLVLMLAFASSLLIFLFSDSKFGVL